MTDDQLIESLRARVAELEALPGNVLALRVEELAADARRWKAIKQRHSIALVRLATGSGSYNSSKAPAILDAWADMAAAEIEAFDPDAYLKEIESRIAAFEASEAAVSKKGIEREPESVNAELLEALKDARHCIGIDRDTLVDCHTNPCTGYLDPDGALAKAEYDDVIDAADAAIARAESAIETPAKARPCAGHAVQQEAGHEND